MNYDAIDLLTLKGIMRGCTPCPFELCTVGLLTLKGVVVVKGFTPYPSGVCAIGLLTHKGVVVLEGVYPISELGSVG